MKVQRIERGPGLYVTPLPDCILKAGDQLLLTDTPANLKQYEAALDGTLYWRDMAVDEDNPLTEADQQLSEIVVVEGSPIEGVTLKDVRFIDRYHLVVLALHRAFDPVVSLRGGMGDVTLAAGDVLLVQGAAEQVAALKREPEILVLDATADLPHTSKAPVAVAITLAVIVTAALGLLPISISAMAGVLLLVTTRCLKWSEAGAALNSQVILIVVASLGLGLALLKTGGANYLAEVFVAATFGAPPIVLLGGLTLMMGVLTNVVSSNAAAVIGTPIAVSIATQIGQPPEAFVIAVIFGSNLCYATPLAHKINVIVMAAGGYTGTDFMRVGLPLAVVMWIAYTVLLGVTYGV
jgi:di/tricarboxylate transporter